MIPVKKVMTKGLMTITPTETVANAARRMKEENIGSLLVSENRKELAGIITETDIVRKVVAMGKKTEETKVSEIMSSPICTIDGEKSIVDANDMMDERHIRHLVVTEDGIPVGIISARDLLHPIYLDREGW